MRLEGRRPGNGAAWFETALMRLLTMRIARRSRTNAFSSEVGIGSRKGRRVIFRTSRVSGERLIGAGPFFD